MSGSFGSDHALSRYGRGSGLCKPCRIKPRTQRRALTRSHRTYHDTTWWCTNRHSTHSGLPLAKTLVLRCALMEQSATILTHCQLPNHSWIMRSLTSSWTLMALPAEHMHGHLSRRGPSAIALRGIEDSRGLPLMPHLLWVWTAVQQSTAWLPSLVPRPCKKAALLSTQFGYHQRHTAQQQVHGSRSHRSASAT